MLVLAALVAVALGGCAKDLELPPASTAPVLSSLSPSRAWAGQLVRIEGTGLDVDPAANVVSFAGASARGLRFDGTALVVRVPADAGSGPVIVTTGRGTSDPFGALAYLGLGEPRRRAVATSRPILQRPLAVHGVGPDVFVHSGLYGGLLKAGDPVFAASAVGTLPENAAHASVAAAWKGALYHCELSPDRASATVRRTEAATGAAAGAVAYPFAPYRPYLVAMRGVDLLVAFGDDESSGSSVPSLAAWDLDTLTTVVAPTPLGDLSFFDGADVGDGRAVALVYDYGSYTATLALLDLSSARGTGVVPAAALVPGDLYDELGGSNPVAVAVADRADPAGISTGEPLAAVALASGDLAVARLGTDPAFVGAVETFSPSTIEALASAATLPMVLATKPDDGLSVGIDLVSRTLLWSVPGTSPGPASASGDLAFVADAADNEVSVVNLASGSRVARVDFGVAPGGSGVAYESTVAYARRATEAAEDAIFFPAASFPAVLRFPLGSDVPTCVGRGAEVTVVAWEDGARRVWAARGGTPPAATGYPDAGAASVAPLGLGDAPDLAATLGLQVVFAHSAGLSLVDGGAFAGHVVLGDGTEDVVAVGFAPDGRIWSATNVTDAAPRTSLWHPAQIASGGSGLADAEWVPSGGRATIQAAAWLEDGLWLLGFESEGVLLGPTWTPVRRVPLAAATGEIHAISPNRRLLVHREILRPGGRDRPPLLPGRPRGRLPADRPDRDRGERRGPRLRRDGRAALDRDPLAGPGRPRRLSRALPRRPAEAPAPRPGAAARRTGAQRSRKGARAGGRVMRIGIIGSGSIGGTAARLFVAAGHEIALAHAGGPESLREQVDALGHGVRAATVEEAAEFGQVVLLAIPWRNRGDLPADRLRGKIVVDAMNPYRPDFGLYDLGDSTSSEEVAKALPEARLVKAFNTLHARDLASRGDPDLPIGERIAILVAGDDQAAKAVAAEIVDDIGFAPVDTGSLRAGGRLQQAGGPLYTRVMTGGEARVAVRSAAGEGAGASPP